MKRIVTVVIACCVFCCAGIEDKPTDVFNKFIVGIADNNLKAIAEVSTETTVKMVGQMIDSKRLIRKQLAYNELVYIANMTHDIHSDIVVIKDSISATADKAWVWFQISQSSPILVAPLIFIDGHWLVDIPVI